MTARHKLNSMHIHHAVRLAGVAGVLTSSWTVFLISLVGLVAIAVHSGDIRSSRQG